MPMHSVFRCFRKITPCVLLLCLLPAFTNAQGIGRQTALDRYVHAPDPAYQFALKNTVPGKGYTAYFIEMTSQSWRASTEVNRTLWTHWLIVVKPDKVSHATGFLSIKGGSNDGKVPQVDPALTELATTTETISAELRMVPNQPLTFADSPKPLTEDALIAYTWDKYFRTGDENWPARLPMTKSAVRAMDTITTFCGSAAGGGIKVNRFVVAGGSKRGWTTWTTAAVDRRVVAIVPMVIDLLNLEKSFEHHYQAYGFWAPAVKDYVDYGIMEWMGTPQFRSLMRLVEPYSYRERLTVPKLLINAAGDQFFLPDSSQFYFDDLKGEKYLRYVPNADHSLRNSDAQQSVIAYYDSLLRGTPRPRFSWKFGKDGAIRVETKDKPAEVKLWQATNTESRDFRLEKIGAAYRSSVLIDGGGGVYEARVAKPPKGWTAFFIELTYKTGGKYPLKLTTPVRVVPETLPHKLSRSARAKKAV